MGSTRSSYPGFYEEWLVVKIAEYMWRLRRATRCESGSVRESGIGTDRHDDDSQITRLVSERSTFRQAEQQLQDTGTLSRELYQKVAPLVERDKNRQIQSEQQTKPVEVDLDRDLFLTCIADHNKFLDSYCKSLFRAEEDRLEAQSDFQALLPEADMDRILRYEDRMHRQLDWAVQRLLETQERRRTRESA